MLILWMSRAAITLAAIGGVLLLIAWVYYFFFGDSDDGDNAG